MASVERINDCKIDLARCTMDELHAMAESTAERVVRAEMELNSILEQIGIRTGQAFMGEDTDTVELVG